MPTDTPRAARPAISFALRLIVWSLALFGLLRQAWVGAHILLPMTRLQAAAGSALVGPSSLPIEATLACSGADALALCLAAIVAYPARWRMRAAGIAGGAALLLVLNTLRIGTLGRAAASPRWFDTLHIYVWPAVLTAAVAGFVFTWMRAVDRRSARRERAQRAEAARPERAQRVEADQTTPRDHDWRVTGRFALLAATSLLVFTLAAPLYLGSARVLALASLVARAAAALLRVLGVDATASAGMLSTPRGAFLVTQECIATPLIPIYLAAVFMYARTWRTRALWLAAGLPLFTGLGIARLLVVAVPGLGASPAFFIHAFSQLLVAVGLVCGAALWRHGARAATLTRILAALALAIAFFLVAGAPYADAILWLGRGTPALADPQGALAFLPVFQLGLLLALWVAAFAASGWTRLLYGAVLLAAIQVAVDVGVHQIAVHTGIAPSVPLIRAWALVAPALVIAAVLGVGRRTERPPRHVRYRAFWDRVGAEFPDLGGAASTALYRQNEQRLIARHLGALAGKRVLKTDLWDEARNTRILHWVGGQGAQVVGVDLSAAVVRMARPGVLAANADVGVRRALTRADADGGRHLVDRRLGVHAGIARDGGAPSLGPRVDRFSARRRHTACLVPVERPALGPDADDLPPQQSGESSGDPTRLARGRRPRRPVRVHRRAAARGTVSRRDMAHHTALHVPGHGGRARGRGTCGAGVDFRRRRQGDQVPTRSPSE